MCGVRDQARVLILTKESGEALHCFMQGVTDEICLPERSSGCSGGQIGD